MEAKANKQPRIFHLMSTISLFDRLSYYVINFSLILAAQQLYKLSIADSTILVGIFGAIAYLVPVIGGYISDKIYGIKNVMIIGIILETIGYFLTATSGFLVPVFGITANKNISHTALFAGLAFVVIGSGLFKTAPTNIIGRSYEADDPRIDSGFTTYYMIINIGGLIAGLISGYAPQFVSGILHRFFGFSNSLTSVCSPGIIGWIGTYYICGIFCLIGLIFLMSRRRMITKKIESEAGQHSLSTTKILQLLFGSLICIILATLVFSFPQSSNWIFGVLSFIFISYIVYEIIHSESNESKKIFVATIMILIAMVFFILYNQLFMSLTLFLQNSTNRHVFGMEIPAPAFIGCSDPIWIIILSYILTKLIYPFLQKIDKEPHITTKFGLGIILAGSGFMLMAVSGLYPQTGHKVSILWPTFGIGIFALGELFVSALGVAMVTKVVPSRLYGFMMGAWYLIGTPFASILAANISKTAGGTTPAELLNSFTHIFLILAILGLAAGVFTILLAPILRKVIESK